ncbi:alpha/beta fold hydrolase [uncultured Oscillibacter sp.]|uniref:alpha/beta fold hydrolase n=1 Tax=uncultured Oscillibacter sp. TaxID=876091 RepID=UPI002623E8C3|nr:alpha/beta hydrolase [uncultured Oscillibacter sp.]
MTGRLVCLHGLGQGPESWEAVLTHLEKEALCPSLPELAGEARFTDLYQAFEGLCGTLPGSLRLCGLSLGGVLALEYAKGHPERVESLVLIGTPLEIPRGLLGLQSLVFRLMPAKAFRGTGFSKQAMISLTASMADLDLRAGLERVRCPVLSLCGERDRTNWRAAQALGRSLPQAVLRQVPGAGHEVNRDAPEALAALLRDFYEQQG